MIIKAAHPIGRQSRIGIIGLSCLLDGRGGRTPDLEFGSADDFGLAADDAVAFPLGPSGPGVDLSRGGPRPGRLELSRLQIERIPSQAQPTPRCKRQHDGDQAGDDPAPRPQRSHAG
ncbi:hypothetical protein [Brevundimonas sp.]|uniref:hypothetical protein n=1 Tax=Brevundimonas sp. TaxID=1871086 RepID=UPI0035151B4B